MANYKRILLKLSGEALSGEGEIFSPARMQAVAQQIVAVQRAGVQCGIVVGAGNIWRGRHGPGMQRTTADAMGMLSTAINALALCDALRHEGGAARVLSAVELGPFAERFSADYARECLEKGEATIFACGSGNPFFSTDTAAALRALEIGAEALLLAKNVDGVYEADPRKVPDARRFTHISPAEVIARGLQAADLTAMTLCMENNLPIEVFALRDEGSVLGAVSGQVNSTHITNDAPQGGVLA
nr:UMP kinase [bacterium]